jgi:cell division protein ZapA (FtsZ GTPase activity inhibitor)
MTDSKTDELKRLSKEARLGDLEIVSAGTFARPLPSSRLVRVYSRKAGVYLTDVIDRDNAALIVAAVNALPELLAENERLREALEEKGSAQWDQAKVGILPEDDSATFFIKMVQFAEKRMAEGEQWMTISMKQYAELLKAAAINAERRSTEGA